MQKHMTDNESENRPDCLPLEERGPCYSKYGP